MPHSRPTAVQVADRAFVLYALVRRGTIELVIAETDGDPSRIRQGEAARAETDAWLERERLSGALTDVERRLFQTISGSWPAEAIIDAMWRKEALGTLLWALQHVPAMPPYGREFEQPALDGSITRYGSVRAFRTEGLLRPGDEVERAWMEADAWFGATEGRSDDDTRLASIAAERYRALSWLRDADARPA
jgi:hypothetical protein